MNLELLRQEISSYLRLRPPETEVVFEQETAVSEAGYTRSKIIYQGLEGGKIPAYFLLPDGPGPFPAVLVHHQHSGQRHFGKSEVCGLVGDPYQAFGPVLARSGIAVVALAQDAFDALNAGNNLQHERFTGGHPLTQARFDVIVDWIKRCCKNAPD